MCVLELFKHHNVASNKGGMGSERIPCLHNRHSLEAYDDIFGRSMK